MNGDFALDEQLQWFHFQEVFRTLMGAKPMMIDSRGKKSSFSPINEQMISDIERRLYVKDADQQREAQPLLETNNNYVYENIAAPPQQETKSLGDNNNNNNPSNIYRPVIWLRTMNDDLDRFWKMLFLIFF